MDRKIDFGKLGQPCLLLIGKTISWTFYFHELGMATTAVRRSILARMQRTLLLR
jgi:hypothetical protein